MRLKLDEVLHKKIVRKTDNTLSLVVDKLQWACTINIIVNQRQLQFLVWVRMLVM